MKLIESIKAESPVVLDLSPQYLWRSPVPCMLYLPVFNAIVRLCITEIPGALSRKLNLQGSREGKKPPLPSSSAQWKRVNLYVKSYLQDLLRVS